ncbi:MAG: phosphatase PAP2 family protein [Herpetosiphonaceae bacterium]|nr:phosphatase PAP2 family protein [Herpetosiphonaceae bacterium]
MPAIDQFGNEVIQGRSYRWGQIISQVFHPTLNGIAAFLVIGLWGKTGLDLQHSLWWTVLAIIVMVTPSMMYFRYRLRRGDFSDDDVSLRGERHKLYGVALVSILSGSAVLAALHIPPAFLRLIGGGVAILVTCALVNLVWKISVHAASVGILATVLTLFGGGVGVWFWLVAGMVGWARLRTGNHTVWQVVAGWSVAIVGVLLAFRIGA